MIEKIPLCIQCKKETQHYINDKQRYSGFCSRKCSTIYYNNKRKLEKEKLLKNAIIYNREKLVKDIQILYQNKNIHKNNLQQSLYKIDVNYIKSIFYYTQYLDEKSKFKERFYHILNDLTELPKCENCGKTLDTKFFTVEKGYNNSICNKCSSIQRVKKAKSSLIKTKREQGYLRILNNIENEFVIRTSKEQFLQTGEIEFYHKICGKTFIRKLAYLNGCPYCSKKGTSKKENEVNLYIESLGFETICNTKPLKDETQKGNLGNREIDILIPKLNIGIEFNGNYYHSELHGKDKKYHINKTIKASEINIDLIHILDSEWNQKQEIVKSILRYKLGKIENRIFARKCKIKEVQTKEKNLFLDNNHLQGQDKSKIKLGLYYEDKLVSIMTFGQRQITGKSSYELIRFCNLINTNVIGAASKLFKYFLNNYWEGQEITTYANRRYSNGNLYHILGFEFSYNSPPNYWYTKDNQTLEHRANYMKHKLKNKLESFDPSLTEWENMQNNNYDRIWDCGNMVFKYNK